MMRVVDDERAARGQRGVRLARSTSFCVEAPVVEDVAHHEHVGRGQRVGEEVAGVEAQPVGEPERRDVVLEERADGGRSKPPPVRCGWASASSTGSPPSAPPTSTKVR